MRGCILEVNSEELGGVDTIFSCHCVNPGVKVGIFFEKRTENGIRGC